MNDDELTPSEKKAFASLPKERVPSAFVEERTVRTLRRHGVLRSPVPRSVEITGRRIAGALAACMAFVVCGFVLGFFASAQRSAHMDMSLPGGNGYPVAVSLQQAGTDYVMALERLAQMSATGEGEELQQGREVALNTLYTAADQMVKIVPRDVLAGCIVHAITTTEDANLDGDEEETPRVIQF
jgi:hypothetical protein